LRILAISKTKKKANVEVEFKEGNNCNAFLPISFFKGQFLDTETKILGHLLKIDPSKPWGDIQVNVRVSEKDLSA